MTDLGSDLLLNLWVLLIGWYGITVQLSINIIKDHFYSEKTNFLSARKSYMVRETFIWSLVLWATLNMSLLPWPCTFSCCRKAMASLNKPDQTGPCCTPTVCVLRVTRTEIKSHYSGDPCDMHKEHEARLSILGTGVFWVSSTYFYTGLAFSLPFPDLLTEHQQQESDPPLLLKQFCSLGLWNANNDCELATGEAGHALEQVFADSRKAVDSWFPLQAPGRDVS